MLFARAFVALRFFGSPDHRAFGRELAADDRLHDGPYLLRGRRTPGKVVVDVYDLIQRLDRAVEFRNRQFSFRNRRFRLRLRFSGLVVEGVS